MKTNKFNIYLILVFMIIGLLAVSGAHAEWPDYGGSCNTARLVDAPSATWGYLYKYDRDYFKIVVGSPGTLTVYTTSSIDTIGYLYDSNCNDLTDHDDIDWPRNKNFQIVRSVSAGTYYVQVDGYRKTKGTYRFHVLFDGTQNHTITATATSGGTISPSGAQTVGHNGNMTFNITPDSCYAIKDIEIDGNSSGAKSFYSFSNITENHTIRAIFELDGPFNIVPSAETGGTIDPSETVSASCGSEKTFSFTPDTGYEIFDVVTDGISRGAISSYTFPPVGEAHTIVAKFKELDQFTITTVAGENGSISPEGPLSVYQGSSQTFTITPDAGYVIKEVEVDNIKKGAISSYPFTNILDNHTIEATFEEDPSSVSTGCLDISDTPLDARFRAAPPLIMFVVDDSGSMDWEVMTAESHSRFGSEGIAYVFDDPGDHFYSITSSYGKILSNDQRKDWKAQWSGYNKMYYNPQVTYDPWPNMDPADTKAPRSHPKVDGVTLTLADKYLDMTDADAVIIDDGDTEFTTGGTWSTMGYWYYAYNKDYRFTTKTEENKTARWSPDLSLGEYNVYAYWVDSGDNASNVKYSLKGNGSWGPTYTENQNENFNQWNLIGSAWFTSSGYVELFLDEDDAEEDQAVADGLKFELKDSIRVNNAHYYTFNDVDGNGELDSGEQVYLVNFIDNNSDGQVDAREWFEVNDDGDDHIQKSELSPISESSVPGAARPNTLSDDLQNFANWYSFHRRRELGAIAAVANVIDQASRMLIGIHSINSQLNEPVHKIDVDGVDERDALLEKLYSNGASSGGTPLRTGLERVGMYFDDTDSTTDTSGIHTLASPYFADADGGACQQAFAILMTDGYYNGTDPAKGNVDSNNGAPYADTYSNTLADIAMYYYEKDLVHDDDLKDLVPANDRDKATHQHMVTYGVGFGVTGTLDPDSYDLDSGPYPTWPNPDPPIDPVTLQADPNADKYKIDDLWHASVNGRGRFLTSSDSNELLNDLLTVFKDIEFYAGSASSVSVNGDELYTRMNSKVMLFQAKYYSEAWHGDVLAYKVDKTNGAIETPAVWSAAKQLSLKSANSRLIATSNGKNKGLTFRFNSLKKTMKKMLDADDTVAQNMLNYLRGDDTYEVDNGGTFRNRTWRINDPKHPLSGQTLPSSKLGDIVHASPVYKNGALYTGGNDGMLHAFDAATGEELFAYIPHLVFENLKQLADPDYSHKYFVDLTPTVADVSLDGGVSVMLVGGLGKGGKGYYALDISAVNPELNSVPANESKVKKMFMWEYPKSNTPAVHRADMGYSFSKATIAKSHDVDDAKYMAIFGNGYNSDNESAVLFILNPADGSLLKKIDTGVTGCNGLSTPMAVDVDFDGLVDYVYAGDLKGNMWKFDLTSPDHNNWDVAFEESSTPKPLFTTAGTSQPITTRPDIMKHCTRDGYLVFFGTGKYLEESDLTDTSLQSIYAVWDYGDDVDDSEYAGEWDNVNETLTNANLPSGVTLQDQDAAEYVVGGKLIRVTTNNKPDWTPTTLSDGGLCGNYSGDTSCDMSSPGTQPEPAVDVAWFMNLPGSGERIVSDMLIREGKLLAISYIPEGSMCGTGGSSWLMEFNACTGSRMAKTIFDRDDDGDIDEDDKVKITSGGTEQKVVPTGLNFDGRLQPPAIIIFGDGTEVLYMSSSKGKIETQRQTSARLGVVYWRIFRP